MKATARAHPNIALVKYWGKRDELLVLPHQGSFSATIDALHTETTVCFQGHQDQAELEGRALVGKELARMTTLLNAIRTRAGIHAGARVASRSNFPASAGLASSAAGFAALALAGSQAAGLPTDFRSVSVLARLGSGSACRSVQGGFCEWLRGTHPGGDDSYAVQRYPQSHWPALRMLAAECDLGAKPVSSRDAMAQSVATSPYYEAWVRDAARELATVGSLVGRRELADVGALCERNAWRMHATCFSAVPPLCFLRPATLSVIERVAELRRDGIGAWFTLDAGPNPVVLCEAGDASRVEAGLIDAGARKVTRAGLGPDATLSNDHLF